MNKGVRGLLLVSGTRAKVETQVNWSNDAGRVAYVEGDETPHVRGRCYLSVVDTTTKAMRVLHESGRIGAPSWSPDDSEIAFVDSPCLKSADARSGEVATVACLPEGWTAENESSYFRGYCDDVCWSPDGRMLAWPVANPDKQRIELWAVDRVNGGHRVVWAGAANYGARISWPDWSHDGRFIAFTLVTDTMVEIRRLRDSRLMSGGGGD
jgi:Tol biopolymer transport system component